MPPPHKGKDVLGQDSWKDVYGKKTWRGLNPVHPHTLDPGLLFMARAEKNQTNFSSFFFPVMAFGIYLRTKKNGCWSPLCPILQKQQNSKLTNGNEGGWRPSLRTFLFLPGFQLWLFESCQWLDEAFEFGGHCCHSVWLWRSVPDIWGERTRPDSCMYSPYV